MSRYSQAPSPELQDPSQFEEGLLNFRIENPPNHNVSPFMRAVKLPFAVMQGLVEGAQHFVDVHTAEVNVPHMLTKVERRTVGEDRTILVSEADPEYIEPSEASTDVYSMGLTEMEVGSAHYLLLALAAQNPDRRIILFTTPGVSHHSGVLPLSRGIRNHPEQIAEENLNLLPWIVKDGIVRLGGVSLGSNISINMAAINNANDNGTKLNVTNVKLISPAIGARNVPVDEKFRNTELTDEERVDLATINFFRHMPVNIAEMLLRHPRETTKCAAVLAAYAMSPEKNTHRLAAIGGNLSGVRQGVEWETMKDVFQNNEVHVLGGSKDPLIHATHDQWLALLGKYPHNKYWLVRGMGHAMTVATALSAEYLAKMEEPSLQAV